MINQVLPRSCRGVRYNAFTLIELIVVVGIIIVLAGLVLSTVGYARKKGARARAEAEIAAMSAACENYKADNGVYPRNNVTDNLNAQTSGDPSGYQTASQYLYGELSGDRNFNYVIDPSEQGNRSYFAFKSTPPLADGTSNSGMLSITRSGSTYTVNYIRDPFGNSYGYSTANQLGDPAKGYNPTFDLWSTSGLTATPGGNPDTITAQWVKNW
jgi:type II secretory pathway pseudopilin PulG